MKTRFYIIFLLLVVPLVSVVIPTAVTAQGGEENAIAIWHFDENSGMYAYDATSNHYDLEWRYNPWSGWSKPVRAEGRWDLGVYFRQKEDNFTKVFDPVVEFPQGLTIGIWIRTDLDETYRSGFLLLGDTVVAGYPKNMILLSVKQGRVGLNLMREDVWHEEIISSLTVNDNQWHFISTRFNAINQIMALFVDAEKQGEISFGGPMPNLERMQLGRREYYFDPISYNFLGTIDDLCLFDTPLPDSTISSIYESGKPYNSEIVVPPVAEPSVEAYYNFDESSGELAYDYSGNE